MKFMVAVGIFALAVLVSTQETQSPQCAGVRKAVGESFRECRPPGSGGRGRRPPGGGSPSRNSTSDSSEDDKSEGRTCVLDKLKASQALSEFVKDCPDSMNSQPRDQFRCIMNKVREVCPRGPRGGRGRGRTGEPRDGPGPRVTPRSEPEVEKVPEDVD